GVAGVRGDRRGPRWRRDRGRRGRRHEPRTALPCARTASRAPALDGPGLWRPHRARANRQGVAPAAPQRASDDITAAERQDARRGRTPECAPQAVAGRGPRRPRRASMGVRAAGRRGAGAPPAEARFYGRAHRPPHRHAYRPSVMGTRGVVTSAHPLASMAGIQMLLAGGNAVDAAVAVGSALNVVEPFMSSAGGIGLMLISRGRERHVLDFIGRSPAAADAAACTDDELAGGPKACATPGNLGGWLAALERFGSMDRARVLAPAIALAENGVPLTFKSVEFIEGARETLGRSAEAQRLYVGNGGPRPGGIVTYKELGSTFRQVAEGGAEVFYRGPIARATPPAAPATALRPPPPS